MARHGIFDAVRALRDRLPFGGPAAPAEWLSPDPADLRGAWLGRSSVPDGAVPRVGFHHEATGAGEPQPAAAPVVETPVRPEAAAASGPSAQAGGPDPDGAGQHRLTAPAMSAGEPAGQPPAAAKKAAVRKTSAPRKAAAKKAAGAKKAAAAKRAASPKPPAGAAGMDQSPAEATSTRSTATKAPAKRATAKKAPARKATAKKVAAKPAEAPAAKPAEGPAAQQDANVPPVRPGEEPWSAEEVQAVREELRLERQRLLDEVADADEQLAEMLRDTSGGSVEDQADAGTRTFEREQEISLAATAAETLAQVDHALRRLAVGEYGVCEQCGQPIGKMRLQAFPRATLCLSCKEQQERR